MIVAAGLAPTVVATLFGSRYDGSVQILRILLAGTAVMVVPTLLAPYFLGQLARPGLLSVLAWINGLVNGAFAIWLIPTFGGSGAAVALLVSQVVGTALLLVLYVRYASTPVDNVVVVQSRDFGVLRQQLASMLGLRSAQS